MATIGGITYQITYNGEDLDFNQWYYFNFDTGVVANETLAEKLKRLKIKIFTGESNARFGDIIFRIAGEAVCPVNAVYRGDITPDYAANPYNHASSYYEIDFSEDYYTFMFAALNKQILTSTYSNNEYSAPLSFVIYDSNNSYRGTETFARIEFKSPILQSISVTPLSELKTAYYVNEQFTYVYEEDDGSDSHIYDAIDVRATYRRAVSGEVYTTAITNYTVVEPDMTTAGVKSVIVGYNGKTTSFNITVYDIASSSFQNIADIKLGYSLTFTRDVTITYDNGVTRTVSFNESKIVSLPDMTTAGNKTFTVSVYDSYTSQYVTHEYTIKVWDIQSIIISNAPTKKVYYADESIDRAGLVINASYGNAGLVNVTQDVTLSTIEARVGEQTITATYRGFTAIFTIYVNGIIEPTLSFGTLNKITNSQNQYIGFTGYEYNVVRNRNTMLAQITMGYKERTYTSSGSYTDVTNSTTNSQITFDNLIINNEILNIYIGDNTIYALYSERGITLRKEFIIRTYQYTRLEILGQASKVYHNVGTSDVFDLSNITVNAYYDNQLVKTLSTTEYIVDKENNTTFELGETTIRFVAVEDNNIMEYITVNCVEDTPASNATLTASGSLNKTVNNNKYYYNKGETINFDNLNLIIDLMESGTQNVTLTPNEYSKRLYRTVDNEQVNHTGFTFTDDDVVGDYTLELSFGNLTPVTYNIVLDYVTAVDISNTSKLVYKAGEPLELNQIYGNMTFASGNTASISDITPITHTFTKSNTANNNSETETLTLTISGVQKSVEFTIICVKSATITLNKTNYNIHDSLDINKVTLTYSDNSPQELLYSREEDRKKIETITWKNDNEEDITISDLNYSDIRETNQLSLVGTYTEAGVSVSITTNIQVKALSEIKITDGDANEKEYIVLDYGSNIGTNLAGYRIYYYFNDNSYDYYTLTANNYNIYASDNSPLNSVSIRDRITNCYMKYIWIVDNSTVDELECEFDLYCMKLDSITLNWGDINSTQYGGDRLAIDSITGITINYSALEENETDENEDLTREDTTKTYANLDYVFSTNEIATNAYIFRVPDETSYTVTLYANYTENGQTISASKVITVYKIELDSLTVSFSGTYSLIENQTLTITNSNTSVTAVYKNSYPSKSIAISDLLFYEKNINDDYVSFDISKHLTVDDDGKTIYVGYGGIYAEFTTLSVSAKQLSSIEITSNSTQKTTFTIGDVFSMKGIEVRATFDNLDTDLIYYEDLVASGTGLVTNRAFEATDITENSITVTVSYTYGSNTETDTYNISLVYPNLASIRVDTSNVNTLFKDGDSFTSVGLNVYAVYENGFEEKVNSYTLTTASFVSNGVINLPTNPDTNKADYGLRVVPVVVENPHKQTDIKTNDKDYKITVTGNSSVDNIWLNIDEIAKNYTVGDVFTAKGVTLMVKDNDGNEYEVDFYTNPAKNTILRKPQKLTVSVMYGKYTLTYDININVAYSDINVTTTDYTIAIGDRNGNLFTSIVHDDTTIELGVKNNGQAIYPIFNEDDVTIDINQAHNDTYGFNVLNDVIANAASKCIGYMDMGLQDEYGNVIRNAHVVLFDDPINPSEADGNVIVKFPHYVSGYADRINKCTFGIIFNKHLFVSGNADFKNCDWHTENINVAQTENYNQIAEGDYTYFSDLDYCYYGTDDTAVVGYDIYRDGDLVVIKESSKTQATLYRREAKMITAVDSQGNTITGYYEDAYPSFDINFNGGDGALSNRSIINFMGDTLYLTKNGLKVLSSKDTTYNKEKIIYDVSSYINPRILNENLEGAYLYAFNEKLILRTSRGIYVGEYTLRNDNKEYEWYFLNNISADLFFEYDEELYFMDDNGTFNKFSKEEKDYVDSARTFIGVGGTLLTNIAYDGDGFDYDEANNRIILNETYSKNLKEGIEFKLITNSQNQKSYIHVNIGSFIETNWRANKIRTDNTYNHLGYIGVVNKADNTIEIAPYNENGQLLDINRMKQNDLLVLERDVYIDLIDKEESVTNEPIVNKKYRLVKVDENNLFNYKYYLVDSDNVKCNFANIKSFRLSYILNEVKNIRITDIQPYNTGKSFKLLGDFDRVLDLIDYNNQNNNVTYSAVITKPSVIESYYITKPYDFGTILYEKTIYQWAIANDTELESYMDVGYLTTVKQGDYSLVVKTASGSQHLKLDDFSFDKIQFTSDKLPHIYNRYRVLSNIGFIRFIFKNNENLNMVLDKLSLTYAISQTIKGVK